MRRGFSGESRQEYVHKCITGVYSSFCRNKLQQLFSDMPKEVSCRTIKDRKQERCMKDAGEEIFQEEI